MSKRVFLTSFRTAMMAQVTTMAQEIEDRLSYPLEHVVNGVKMKQERDGREVRLNGPQCVYISNNGNRPVNMIGDRIGSRLKGLLYQAAEDNLKALKAEKRVNKRRSQIRVVA